MPRYDWRCTVCGRIDEVIIPMLEFERARDLPRPCPSCGGSASQRYHPAWATVMMVPPSLYPYFDTAADQVFENRQQKDAYLREHDLQEVGYTMV